MRKLYFTLFFISLALSCKNIDNADPSPLTSFIRFYEGPYSMIAQSVEEVPGGFVILATMVSGTISEPIIQTILIETDEKGIRKGDFHIYDGITGKSFKPLLGAGGYIIIGDKIVIDPSQPQAANVSISSMEILIIDNSFDEVDRMPLLSDTIAISDDHPVKADYFGAAVTVIEKDGPDKGKIFLLGTYKKGIINQQSAPEEQFLYALKPNLDKAWVKFYPLLSNTFLNSKSIHAINGNIVWASAVADIQGDFTSSYVAIPFVPENSFPSNYSMIGETTPQLYLPKDIQPSSIPEFGFGVTGTYSFNIDGSGGNIFFFKVDINGNIISGSERFFDGENEISATDQNSSTVVDNGESLIGTKDGGFAIVGTITNSSTKDKDIVVIKLNAFGDHEWIRRFGASGDEVPVSIKEAENGDLVICGTNTLGNYSSIFLMRTDSNGEIKN